MAFLDNTRMRRPFGARFGGALLVTSVWLAAASWALGGPPTIPVECQLDLAEMVVVGKIIRIEPNEKDANGSIRIGTASIAVRETLKGEPNRVLQQTVVTEADANLSAPGLKDVRKVGDEGIWVISASPSDQPILLPEKQKARVKKVLKELKGRSWSEKVNGLRGWAKVAGPDGKPILLFAIRNDSNVVIYYPEHHGVTVSGHAVHDGGRRLGEGFVTLQGCRFYSSGPSSWDRRKSIKPGQVVYLLPDPDRSDPTGKNPSPGRYAFTVELTNRGGKNGQAFIRGEWRPVVSWTGELKVGPVILHIRSKHPKPDTAPAEF